jgi:hypothetical protein
VRYWQIWNEPNNPIFWQPKPDAAQYAKMLKAVHRAVRRANPRANIVMGGLSLVDLKYLENLYGEGAAEYFDILAVHPYNPAQSPAAYLGHEFLNLKAVMAGAGDIDKKIWITELGWHTSTSTTGVSQREQAEYVTQLYELAESMDAVQAVFWHTLEDCGIGFRAGNPEHNFGLFNGNHLAKPSARAYREAVNAYGKRQ